MALDATPGGPSSNAYLTEATATAYLGSERLFVSAWTSASSPDREKALIWATFILDQYYDWDGSKQNQNQALRWPRAGVIDPDGFNIDYLTIPKLLEKATATLALRLLEGDRVKEPALLGLGFSKASLGPLSVEVDSRQIKSLIPDDVLALLVPLGSPKGESARGDRIVKVYRG